MSLSFLTRPVVAAGALDQFDLRDRRDEGGDDFEAARAEPVEFELSVAGAVARYKALQRGGTATELLNCGVELLALGPDTHKMAVEAFGRAARFEGAEAEGLFWLGEAHADAGRAERAIHYYRESLRHETRPLTQERLREVQEGGGGKPGALATGARPAHFGVENPTE